MIRLTAFIILILTGLIAPGQPAIDFGHRRILKAIEKEWGIPDPELHEIILPDTLRAEEAIQGKFFRVLNTGEGNNDHLLYVGRVNSCRAGGCGISLDEELYGNSEYFDYFILFNAGPRVREVQVYNYQATHGQEVSARGWLRQFEGYDGSGYLGVGKDIDAISGATISVYAITQDVMDKTRILARIAAYGDTKKIAASRGSSD